MTYFLYNDDVSSEVKFGDVIAIDTETMGLNINRDRLCLIQLSSGDGIAHLVQISKKSLEKEENFPNLKKIFKNPNSTKLFHFARFDMAVIEKNICKLNGPIYCTKIASKLARTYTDKHGLKEICKELINIEMSKQQQSSDWGKIELSKNQMNYAANDVLYLHDLKDKLDAILKREDRIELAYSIFKFLPTRVKLDLMGWANTDIFSHS